MLLAVDIGNTNLVFGVYKKGILRHSFRVSTDRGKTADEYGILMLNLFATKEIGPQDLDGAVLASVVPPLTVTLVEACRTYFNQDPLVLGPGVKTGIDILYDSPRDVGADRIANSAAIYREAGGPSVVVDFGTATTFDVVSEGAQYLGGVIYPGIGISAEALFDRTARLPRVSFTPPENVIGRNTAASIQSGLIYGYAAMVDGIIARIERELGRLKCVVATGGLAETIAKSTTRIDEVDQFLTLRGLYHIYHLNREA